MLVKYKVLVWVIHSMDSESHIYGFHGEEMKFRNLTNLIICLLSLDDSVLADGEGGEVS